MTHELHTLTGAYALDALDEDERRAFAAHLADCEACAAEIEGLRATGAMLGVGAAGGVPPSLREAVMAEVRRTRQLTPLPVPVPDDGRVLPLLRRARATSRALLAVAAVLLVVAGTLAGVAVREQRQAAQSRQVAAQISAVIGAPDARRIEGGGAARVYVSPSQGKAVFVGQRLPATDADHVLQLWVLDGGARSVGIIRGSTALLATGVRPGAKLGVTVEPEGGSKQPTAAPVMMLDLSA